MRMGSQLMQYTGGPLMCNGYLVKGAENEYVAVDAPAGFAAWAAKRLPEGAKLTHLLLTHQHFDHIQDAAALQRATGCTIHTAMPTTPELTLAQNAREWGIPEPEPYCGETALHEHDAHATLAGLDWHALHIPGHSPDGIAWALPASKAVFVGDILFAGSIGRTDFPGGSLSQLVRGIRSKILTLPPDTQVYPGHGPATSVGEEELNNPFIQG